MPRERRRGRAQRPPAPVLYAPLPPAPSARQLDDAAGGLAARAVHRTEAVMISALRLRRFRALVQAAVGVVGRRIVRRGEGLRGIRIVRYEEYGWLKKSNIQTVVDIGANEGQFARLAAELFPAARILSFEPLPDVYERLVRSMRGHPR